MRHVTLLGLTMIARTAEGERLLRAARFWVGRCSSSSSRNIVSMYPPVASPPPNSPPLYSNTMPCPTSTSPLHGGSAHNNTSGGGGGGGVYKVVSMMTCTNRNPVNPQGIMKYIFSVNRLRHCEEEGAQGFRKSSSLVSKNKKNTGGGGRKEGSGGTLTNLMSSPKALLHRGRSRSAHHAKEVEGGRGEVKHEQDETYGVLRKLFDAVLRETKMPEELLEKVCLLARAELQEADRHTVLHLLASKPHLFLHPTFRRFCSTLSMSYRMRATERALLVSMLDMSPHYYYAQLEERRQLQKGGDFFRSVLHRRCRTRQPLSPTKLSFPPP